MPETDVRALREAFSAFMTGVTIVATRDADGAPLGFTANSFTSVSLEPPLLLVCISNSSQSLPTFLAADGFSVNILSANQEDLSRRFAQQEADRFDGVDWREGPAGHPVLHGCCGWFDCTAHQRVEAGDHMILIGEVVGFDHHPERPLGYSRGGYFSLEA